MISVTSDDVLFGFLSPLFLCAAVHLCYCCNAACSIKYESPSFLGWCLLKATLHWYLEQRWYLKDRNHV